jgi:hypothetical protein
VVVPEGELPGVGLEPLELTELLTELDDVVVELTGLELGVGFCLSTRYRCRALWAG